MEKYQRVDGHPNLVRDKRTGAILNTNKTEIERVRRLNNAKRQSEEHINNLTNQVAELKSDMDFMKDLLLKLVEKDNV